MPKIIKNGIEYAGNDNLSNYYTKDETYSKVEVDALIGSFANFEVVEELPTTDISTSTIYLVPKSTAEQDNVYDEYINTDGTTAGWELIGDTEVDLSNYYTKTETDALIEGLDETGASNISASKTIKAWSETDGHVSITTQNIALGNITYQGKLQTTAVDIANGDQLVVTDSSNSDKVAKTSTSFDGSTTTKALTPKGTFEDFAKAGDISDAIALLDGNVTGSPSASKTLASFSETDGIVSATFQDIAIAESQVTNLTTDLSNKANTSDLATVATTGDYDDLSNKPTIPDAVAVKGDAELTYRTGNVNLTPANIGALALTGGTLEGDLVLNKSWSQIVTDPPTPTDEYARLKFNTKYTPTGSSEISNASYIDAHSPGSNTGGNNLVINPRGNIFIGGGEAPNNHYNEKGMTTGEVTYITGDNVVNIQANANTIANRRGLQVSNSHTIVPVLADTPTNNVGSIGSSNYKWKDMYATTFHGALDGDASTVNGHTVAENVPSGAVFTDTTYTASGLVSIDANNNITTSAEANVQSDWSQSDNTADDYIKNKPTIPTVNDGTLTIKHNGTTKQTFTANQSTNVDADIEAVDWVSNSYLGAKNLLPYPYYHTTQTVAGLNITDNGDGTLYIANTSTSSGVIFYFIYGTGSDVNLPLKKEKYKFTWGTGTTPRLDINVVKSDNTTQQIQGSSGYIELDNTNGDYKGINYARLRIGNNVTTNKTVYPMLRLASDTDENWQPYAMTNKELTDKKIGKWQDLGSIANGDDITNVVNNCDEFMISFKIGNQNFPYVYNSVIPIISMTDGMAVDGWGYDGNNMVLCHVGATSSLSSWDIILSCDTQQTVTYKLYAR